MIGSRGIDPVFAGCGKRSKLAAQHPQEDCRFALPTALFAAPGELGPPDGFWLAVTSLFVIERIWTVRARGRRGMVLAAPIVVEFGYDLFQQAVFLRAAADALARRAAHWHHAAPPRAREA